MRFKEYLCEAKETKLNFRLEWAGHEIKTFKDIVSRDKELRVALQNYALEDEWDGSAYDDLMNVKVNADSMNGAYTNDSLVNRFLGVDNSVLIHLKSTSNDIWDASTYDVSNMLMNVDNQQEIIGCRHDSYKIQKISSLQHGVLRNVLDIESSNIYDFNYDVKTMGYDTAVEITDHTGSHPYTILRGWILFKL